MFAFKFRILISTSLWAQFLTMNKVKQLSLDILMYLNTYDSFVFLFGIWNFESVITFLGANLLFFSLWFYVCWFKFHRWQIKIKIKQQIRGLERQSDCLIWGRFLVVSQCNLLSLLLKWICLEFRQMTIMFTGTL